MDHSAFETFGFHSWFQMTEEHRASVYNSLPERSIPGVYVVRYKEYFGRFRGQSDILYVGRGTREKGLRGRVQDYYGYGKDGHRKDNSVRIREMWLPADELWMSVITTAADEHAEQMESKLLERYRQDHGELPPANRSAGKG